MAGYVKQNSQRFQSGWGSREAAFFRRKEESTIICRVKEKTPEQKAQEKKVKCLVEFLGMMILLLIGLIILGIVL